jgi:type IV pilus assembly protein PilF
METNDSVSKMKIATNLFGLLICLVMLGCVSSESVSRKAEPTEEAFEHNYQLGAQYYRNGSYELARARLERSIELEPKSASAHSLLALTMVELGNDRLATESFARSVRLDPNNEDVRNAFAVYLCQKGQYDEALEQLDRAIAIHENDNKWVEMTNAGVCVAKKPDLARAEAYFRDALALRPAYGEALIQMAALKHRTEDNLTARAFLQRYLAANPPSAPVLYLAVQIETGLNDDRSATDYMNQLLRDFPESAEAKLMLQQDSQSS